MILILPIAILTLSIIFITIALTFFMLFSMIFSSVKGAPYIKNDDIVIYHALKMANVNEKTKLADLGSGDGKVLFMAKKFFSSDNLEGYEISPWPYRIAKLKCWMNKAFNKIKFFKKSIFDVNLANFDVIYVYLLPALLKKLKPQIENALKVNPNLKIVTPVFKIDGLTPIKEDKIYHRKFNQMVNIYMYGKS